MFPALRAKLAARAPAVVEKDGIMETAVALILAPGERGLEALFIRRAERPDDPWSGHIALPGGRREPGDADRYATAVRETEEEVGLRLPKSAFLGALDDLHPATPRLPPLVIRPFVFGLDARPAAATSDEVAAVLWIPLAELEECREADCFRTRGVRIWGLAYRILTGFLALSASK